jgi:dihydrofolate reductase
MARVRVHTLAISLDGCVAGPGQSLTNPLGIGGERLHDWVFATRSAREAHGQKGGAEGIDNDWIARGEVGIGATIMGRNMFGPIRGPWPDEEWVGWWGNDPPFHHPVFVLTHHAREPVHMDGGTTFHFVTDGIRAALERALDAAGGSDVRIGGGASVVRQYLDAGLIDEMHLAIVPILLGNGERPFERAAGNLPDQYECVEFKNSDAVSHALIARK